ncbi:MAG: 2Fe-2S iron-sulfur cluster-binding protein [Gammaproteobacteria bacterium]|nr:2Fe-2S iron-sulfur cluster-binding protein [Gammaproteobacteria bacterium]
MAVVVHLPVKVTFIHPDGRRETRFAPVGDSVMDCALDNDVAGIAAQCGGGCTCSTCHCYVEAPWFDMLPTRIEDERELLTYVEDRLENSRLTCQIYLTEELDGIEISIPSRDWT